MKKTLVLLLVCFSLFGCEYSKEKQRIYDEVYLECIDNLYEMYEYCDCNARFFASQFNTYAEYKKWLRTDANTWGNPINKAYYKKCTPIFEAKMRETNPDFKFEEEAMKILNGKI